MGLFDWLFKRNVQVANVDVPVPDGLSLYDFQKQGVNWLRSKDRAILADEMGLGKTVQVAGLLNTTQSFPVLIVCPASLKINWRNELQKWLTHEHSIQVLNGKSMLENAEITIINYDILGKHDILSRHYKMVVCDEAHYLKNPQTKRYKSLFNGLDTDRLYFLTGTPITNRPVELWPLLKQIDKAWSNYKWFTGRYCNAQMKRVGWDRVVRDVSGASNLDELHSRIKPFMLRRLRQDVLSELPDKTKQIITLPANGAVKIIASENDLTKRRLTHLAKLEANVSDATSDNEFAYAVSRLENYITAQFSELATTRKDLGMAKVKPAIEHINNILDAGEKVVVFAHHRDVIRELTANLPGALVVDGSVPAEHRQRIVDEFQNNPEAKVFIGNIKAAGTGITLTAAHHVVFVELDWTPGNMSQAEDRVVRIGQQNNVLIQLLVFDGSLDARIANILVYKQRIINKAIEGKS